MPYEVFERKTPRLGTPMMSFSKIGQITFNQSAATILKKLPSTHILLMWDVSAKKLAIRSAANEKDPRAFVIRHNEKANGASFSAKTFLDHVGINYAQRRAIPIEINPNAELVLEVKIPEMFFNQENSQPVVIHTTSS